MLIARVHWRLCAGNHPTVWYAALTIAALKQAQSSLVGPICGSHRLETGLSADRRRRTGLGSNIENGARHGNRHQAETAFPDRHGLPPVASVPDPCHKGHCEISCLRVESRDWRLQSVVQKIEMASVC
jgi:hypothetical protein